MDTNYSVTLKKAEDELQRLQKKRAEIDQRMVSLARVIEGLRELSPTKKKVANGSGAGQNPKTSLPDTIIAVLSSNKEPMQVLEIKRQLIANHDVAPHIHLGINVHTSLKRLVRNGRVQRIVQSDGKKLYRYIPPMEMAVRGTSNAVLLSKLLKAGQE